MENLTNIQNQLSSTALFEAFKQQLIKDFEQSSFPVEAIESINPNYNKIHGIILSLLQHNEFSSQHNIMQLIYRVDISETQLAKYLNEHKDRNYFDVIAELIIKRVLQKVVLKQHFKNNENV